MTGRQYLAAMPGDKGEKGGNVFAASEKMG